MTITITKQMAITEKMFLGSLPRALDSDAYVWDGKTVVLEEGGKRLEIAFSETDNFRLGNISIPRSNVTLTFEGYGEAEAEDALARFDRYFHRGGG